MVQGKKALLVKPASFMNRSGFPIQKISAYFNVEHCNIIVVHDELDLPFGRIMIVKSRGHGGHNGIRSIIDSLGGKDFTRIRVGVGRSPNDSENAVGHVLGKFAKDEMLALDTLATTTADACELILSQGVQKAMNSFNINKSS